MGFNDHVSVKMGLDKSGFESGLRGVKGSLDTFKGALSALGVGFSLGAARGFFADILDMAETLDRQSEALGVSTDFLQGWQAAARQSGSDSETAAKALDKFTAHLKETGREGADVETEIRRLADRIAATNDPVARVGLAVEAFGEKIGARLVPTLQGGSRALSDFIASAKKLSPDEIRRLQEVGDRIEEAKNNLKVAGGGLLNGFLKLVEAAGAASTKVSKTGFWDMTLGDRFIKAMGEASHELEYQADLESAASIRRKKAAQGAFVQAQAAKKVAAAYTDAAKAQAEADFEALEGADRLDALLQFRDQLLASITKKPTIENAQKLAGLARVGADIAKEQKSLEEERLKIIKEQAAATERQVKAAQALTDAKTDRSGLTLQELANATPATAAGAQNILAARAALNAEDFARRARIEGRDDLAEKATDFALGIRGRLSPLSTNERDPLRNLEENMAEAKEALQTMLDKGLPIIPQTGE